LDNFLVDANRDFVEQHTPVYREWMQSLLQADAYPALFHCTAGKDRTGFAAALVLAALDVPQDTIYQDYLATNSYTEDYREKVKLFITLRSFGKVDGDTLEPLFGVERRYLEEAFKAIDEHYGS